MKLPDNSVLDAKLRPLASLLLDMFPWVDPNQPTEFSPRKKQFKILPHPGFSILTWNEPAFPKIGAFVSAFVDSRGFFTFRDKEEFAWGDTADTIGALSALIGKLVSDPPKVFLEPFQMFQSAICTTDIYVLSPSKNAFRFFKPNLNGYWKPEYQWTPSNNATKGFVNRLLSSKEYPRVPANALLPGIPKNIAETLSEKYPTWR
jgi:hypothetical protein